MKPGDRGIYIGIMTASMLDSLAVGILLPIIPFMALEMGASAFAVGALFSIQFISGALGSPILGRISDYVPRGVLLLISLISITAGYWLLTVTSSLLMLFLVRGFIGFMNSNLVILESIVAEISSIEDRSLGIARLRIGSTVGLILGPGMVALLQTFKVLEGNPSMLVLAAGIATFPPLVIAYALRGQLMRTNPSTNQKSPYRNVLKFFKTKAQVRDFALIKALIAMCAALIMGIAPVWSKIALGWTSIEVSSLLLAFGLSLFFVQVFIATNSLPWLTGMWALFLACCIVVSGFVAIVIYPSGLSLLSCCVLIGLSSAIVNITVPATISTLAYADVGAVLGLVSTTTLIGSTVSPIFFGFVYEAFGSLYAWGCGSICAGLAAYLAYKYLGTERGHRIPIGR